MNEGDVINDRFELTRLVSKHEVGFVFEAVDRADGAGVILKSLESERVADEREITACIDQVRALAAAAPDHAASSIEADTFEDDLFVVSKRLEGAPLDQILEHEGALDPRRVVRLLVQACQGLTAAADLGVHHLGLRPDKILSTQRAGQSDWVELLDFGFTRLQVIIALDRRRTVEPSGAILFYLAPELLRGGEVDARSDVYSLGVLAYQALTGRLPFQADSYDNFVVLQATTNPQTPSHLRPSIKPELEQVVMQAIERVPERRFGSAAELAAALEPFGGVPSQRSAAPPSAVSPSSGPPLIQPPLAPPTSSAGAEPPRAPNPSAQPPLPQGGDSAEGFMPHLPLGGDNEQGYMPQIPSSVQPTPASADSGFMPSVPTSEPPPQHPAPPGEPPKAPPASPAPPRTSAPAQEPPASAPPRASAPAQEPPRSPPVAAATSPAPPPMVELPPRVEPATPPPQAEPATPPAVELPSPSPELVSPSPPSSSSGSSVVKYVLIGLLALVLLGGAGVGAFVVSTGSGGQPESTTEGPEAPTATPDPQPSKAPAIPTPTPPEPTKVASTAPTTSSQPAVTEPPMANPWMLVVLPEDTELVLGVSSESAPMTVRGFRPSAGVTAPEDPFELQQHEVTWSELEPWLSKHPDRRFRRPGWLPTEGSGHYPATGVSWTVARDFCSGLGGALPTEAEWEAAARGPERRPHPWGTEPIDTDATHVFRRGPLSKVMSNTQDRTPGARAIFDLAGNALEWTADRYRPDAPTGDDLASQAEGLIFRTIRGLLPVGSRPPNLPQSSAAHRRALCAEGQCSDATARILQHVGFRCARRGPAVVVPETLPEKATRRHRSRGGSRRGGPIAPNPYQ